MPELNFRYGFDQHGYYSGLARPTHQELETPIFTKFSTSTEPTFRDGYIPKFDTTENRWINILISEKPVHELLERCMEKFKNESEILHYKNIDSHISISLDESIKTRNSITTEMKHIEKQLDFLNQNFLVRFNNLDIRVINFENRMNQSNILSEIETVKSQLQILQNFLLTPKPTILQKLYHFFKSLIKS